jgi:SAM-dependent methyltransferase
VTNKTLSCLRLSGYDTAMGRTLWWFWRRFTGSVRRRGLLRTLARGPRAAAIAAGGLNDGFFDYRHGTETRRIVELADLRITSPNKGRGVRCEPTRARSFERLMQVLRLPTDGGFVDFGCGKGRVLIMAAEYGFQRVTGVEFSEELCGAARANVAAFLSHSETSPDIRVFHMDAADYEVQRDDTVFYFFNPFDATVLERVVGQIVASLELVPRKASIIYLNPLWPEAIEKHGKFERLLTCEFEGRRFDVYTCGDNR